MGWKAIKEAYGIEHIVCVTAKGICIGSGYVHDLAVIDPASGTVRENNTFSGFLAKNYPGLAAASPDDILGHVQAEDSFAAALPVFTFEGASIIEKRCEALGWPNLTHDGDLMYENRYSADREVVIGWAKRSVELEAAHLTEAVSRAEEQLADLQSRLVNARAHQEKLATDWPAVILAE